VILLVAGCLGVFPFRNEPPVMLSMNGVPTPVDFGETGGYFQVFEELEDEQPIAIQVRDPERDGVRAWFPYLMGTMEWDDEALEGIWRPDLDNPDWQLDIVLEDDKDPPARSQWTFGWRPDTG
jgi:hypothetical protein